MSTKQDSAPLPWDYERVDDYEDMCSFYALVDANGKELFDTSYEELAKLTLRLVNTHAALVSALEKVDADIYTLLTIVDDINHNELESRLSMIQSQIASALAAAKGEQ